MKTKTRRLLQALWNVFDSLLLEHADQGLILCVSGGADSRALMESAALWPRRFASICVVSIDHGVRPESVLEARWVCDRARVLGFESKLLSLKSTVKDEASLRKARYQAIWKQSQGRVLVTAHHQDDQAEGFVMDLMGLGGGPEGAGMLPKTKLEEGLVLRPFLGFSKSYLLAVLTALGKTDYFCDPTGGSRVRVREFLRLHPAPAERLSELAKQRRADWDLIQKNALQYLRQDAEGGIMVRFSKDTPEVLRLRALKAGLAQIVPEHDLRNGHKTLQKIAKIYDLPGCKALLSSY